MVGVTRDEFDALVRRIELVERANAEQTHRLNLQRKALLGCASLVVVGMLLGKVSLSAENRATLESLAVAAIASGVTGVFGSQFVEPKKETDYAAAT